MISVVVPVYCRPEVIHTLDSLSECHDISQLIVCEAILESRSCFSWQPDTFHGEYLHLRSNAPFNKASLINEGISHITGSYVMISDADIIWSARTVLQLRESCHDCIVHVAEVVESDPGSIGARVGSRIRWNVQQQADSVACVQIYISPSYGSVRAGPGLVMCERSTIYALGGYVESFHGWGWEDQDLLIRACILGYEVKSSGAVVHLSHSDALRLSKAEGDLELTRNRNLRNSLRLLIAGQLHGPLCPRRPMTDKAFPRVVVDLPPELSITEG